MRRFRGPETRVTCTAHSLKERKSKKLVLAFKNRNNLDVASDGKRLLTVREVQNHPVAHHAQSDSANTYSPNRMPVFYPGVLTPFFSISMAFSILLNRVSSFLASVTQRQYSLRWV
jgi:hypothetical protein